MGEGEREGDWRWFRYPFLAEGDQPEKRTAIRVFLADRGYRVAAVTMSFSDYAYNEPYARCRAKGDETTIARMEAAWLEGARTRSTSTGPCPPRFTAARSRTCC